MGDHDLVVRGGTVAAIGGVAAADVAIDGERITVVGTGLGRGAREVDATGMLVLPGGVDVHCHVEQRSSSGVMTADDFASASISAAHGGTTTIVPFAAQHRGDSLREAVDDAVRRAGPKMVVDYGFHLILADPTSTAVERDLPALVADGFPSFKVYMTYERLRLDDEELERLMRAAVPLGALPMVHAEDHRQITEETKRLVRAGHTEPQFHAIAHSIAAEVAAVERVSALAARAGAPLFVVHVSSGAAVEVIRSAQGAGQAVFGETCPQYLLLTSDDLDRPGLEGAKFACSPPPRAMADQQRLWAALGDGTLEVCSSDHSPYRFDGAKLPDGDATRFDQMASGVPGIELRMALLFSAGVLEGRLDLETFVAVTATNPARRFGLYPRKGAIAPGSDADLVVWDPEAAFRVTIDDLHDAMDYTPYEGREVRGRPVLVVSRGEVIVEDGMLRGEPGRGLLLRRPAGLPLD